MMATLAFRAGVSPREVEAMTVASIETWYEMFDAFSKPRKGARR